MPVRQSSPRERARFNPVAPPHAHLIQPRIPGQGPHNNERSISPQESATHASSDERSPIIKITLYRLLNSMIILGVGTGKYILAMQGHSISPTILDWVLGSLYVIVTYWIGFLEDVRPSVWPWFFYEDYVTPRARRWFSFLLEAVRHRWKDIKRSWKRDLCAILLAQLGILIPVLLIPKLALNQNPVPFFLAEAVWGGMSAYVAYLVFPDSLAV